MATVLDGEGSGRPAARGRGLRDPFVLGVAALVLLALALRLWGIRWGLPLSYNLDERSHFVPRAVAFFAKHSINPDYQLNPSGLIEWIALALAVVHRSSHKVVDTWQTDPGEIWTVARVAGALLATSAIALIALAGARLFDRRAGLVAAALLATMFLPVHYGHLALNDAPSLAPTALGLWAIAGILRLGRRRDYVLAGLALGTGIGLKYNAAFLGLPLLTAVALRVLNEGGEARGPAVRTAALGLVLTAVAALIGLFVTDPYAFLDTARLRADLTHLSDYTKGGLLLGETQTSGHKYYLWSIGWGYGYLPALLTAVGGVILLAKDRAKALLLIPAPVVFFLYVGAQGRYFARYIMPVFPVMVLVAAAGIVWLADRLAPRLRTPALLVLAVLACGQGLVTSVHNDRVLARDDTRSLARAWMVRHIPAGTTILVEPLVPQEWYRDGGRPGPDGSTTSQAGYRWKRFVRTRADIRRQARVFKGARRRADFANYAYTLYPGLIPYYRARGVCWIVSGSTQSGRAFNNPRRTPQAIAYYRALQRAATPAFVASPFGGPNDGPRNFFQFDKAFNFYSLAYDRPGPRMTVYRLKGCTPS